MTLTYNPDPNGFVGAGWYGGSEKPGPPCDFALGPQIYFWCDSGGFHFEFTCDSGAGLVSSPTSFTISPVDFVFNLSANAICNSCDFTNGFQVTVTG